MMIAQKRLDAQRLVDLDQAVDHFHAVDGNIFQVLMAHRDGEQLDVAVLRLLQHVAKFAVLQRALLKIRDQVDLPAGVDRLLELRQGAEQGIVEIALQIIRLQFLQHPLPHIALERFLADQYFLWVGGLDDGDAVAGLKDRRQGVKGLAQFFQQTAGEAGFVQGEGVVEDDHRFDRAAFRQQSPGPVLQGGAGKGGHQQQNDDGAQQQQQQLANAQVAHLLLFHPLEKLDGAEFDAFDFAAVEEMDQQGNGSSSQRVENDRI